MSSNTIEIKRGETCQVHGAPAKAANRTLLLMIAAGFGLILWRVWAFGPTSPAAAGQGARSFPLLVATEIWDLFFDRHGIVAELWDILPYFLVGILLAGYIRTYKIAVKLQARLRQYGIASVFLASFVGIVTPLCACGTLTTAISLLFAGLPLAPVMALLVTSPLMSPSTYLLTLNDLGPEWTVIRTVAAFGMGVFAGVITHLLRERGFTTERVFIEGAIPRGDFHDEAYPDERLRCNCKEKFGNRVAARTGNMFLIFLAKSAEMLWTVGKYVLVGVAIGAIVERTIPFEWIYRLFGRKDALNILWITLGSVPMFLHQISASSIVYHIKSSLPGTLDGAAALAFMIGGPVTAVPTMVLFWTVFKKRVFVLYLFICLAGTLLFAYGFQLFVFAPNVDMGNPLLKDVRSLSGGDAAVISKQGKDVRMVMDPEGKGMIAFSSDDLAQRGGVVADAGLARILSADRHDNKAYLGNAADWLEQANISEAKNRILIYDTASSPDTHVGVAIGAAKAALEQRGFAVTVSDRSKLPHLSLAALKEYSQIWIVARGALADAELAALEGFSGAGKSLLIAAGTADAGAGDPSLNRLASPYGFSFAGRVAHGEELSTTTGSFFLQRASGILGKVLKFFHKA